MYLNCCNTRINVWVESNLTDGDGVPSNGVFWPDRGIILDASLAIPQRKTILLHEVGHAYEHYMGVVDSEDYEGRQNRMVQIYKQFEDDIAAQGGERAIHELFGDKGDSAAIDEYNSRQYVIDDEFSEWPTAVWCPRCFEQYPARALRNTTPALLAKINGWMIKRTLICAKCNKETEWGQQSTAEGVPLPNVIVSPVTRTIPHME